jgi:eukaryotic-like serine/threonine-protein kinase
VLMVQENRTAGIRGRSSPEAEERELGWFDNSWIADISRDGKTLLFTESGIYGGNLYAVCMRGMDGSEAVKLGEGLACSLSPDGKWALAIHLGQPQRLLRLPTGSGDSTSLPRGRVENYYHASWFPDGKRVMFVGSEAGHAHRIYIQDLQGGLPRAISPEGIAGWRASPDGRFVAARTGDQRLYVLPASGGSARFVTQLLPGEGLFGWAPNGRSLYVAEEGVSMTVFQIEVATGKRSPWKTFSLPDPAGAVIPSLIVTPDGRGHA